MTNAITGTTQNFGRPYLTLQEYKNAPTAIDIDNLVFNSIDPDAQDTELANVIGRASSWIDTHCNQILAATTETEQQRGRYRPDGTIIFHPRYAPIVALTALAFGSNPNELISVADVSQAWLEDEQVVYPYGYLGTNWTSQGPLSFAFPAYPSAPLFLRYTYVNGYANSVTVTAAQGASTLTVDSGVGFYAGLTLKIYDGLNAENVTVASNYTFGSTSVPLTSPLLYTHDAGVSISALPPAIKQAAILVTTSFLKMRGDNSLVMAVGTQPSQANIGNQNIAEELTMAMELLRPYRRIR